MALDAAIVGGVSGRKAEVDTGNNVQVNMPLVASQAGFLRLTGIENGVGVAARVTEVGAAVTGSSELLFATEFNAGTLLNNQWNVQASTMTVGMANAGFVRINSAGSTASGVGASLVTARSFMHEAKQKLSIEGRIRHTGGDTINKIAEFGLGMYVVASGQQGVSVEFVGFRWTTTGTLIGAVELSSGGAPVLRSVNLNGGVPLSDNVVRNYRIELSLSYVEFWVDDVLLGTITQDVQSPRLLKGAANPIMARVANTGTASPAFMLDMSSVTVHRTGSVSNAPAATQQALMGRHAIYHQTGVSTTFGTTATNTTSGAAPAAPVASNSVQALTGLGGFFSTAMTGGFGTTYANSIICAYQNPAYPIIAGASNHGRNLVITDVYISPLVVLTLLVGGGSNVGWWISIGNTSASQAASSDTNGTTTLGTKATRLIPLGAVDTIAAAQAAGTVCVRTGGSSFSFATPLVIHPGEFLSVGVRTYSAAAVYTGGSMSGGVGFSGYWE